MEIAFDAFLGNFQPLGHGVFATHPDECFGRQGCRSQPRRHARANRLRSDALLQKAINFIAEKAEVSEKKKA